MPGSDVGHFPCYNLNVKIATSIIIALLLGGFFFLGVIFVLASFLPSSAIDALLAIFNTWGLALEIVMDIVFVWIGVTYAQRKHFIHKTDSGFLAALWGVGCYEIVEVIQHWKWLADLDFITITLSVLVSSVPVVLAAWYFIVRAQKKLP